MQSLGFAEPSLDGFLLAAQIEVKHMMTNHQACVFTVIVAELQVITHEVICNSGSLNFVVVEAAARTISCLGVRLTDVMQ